MDQGYLQSPSPEDQKVSENTAPRRSKRLRTSLAVYREQQILPDNLGNVQTNWVGREVA